MRCPPLGDWEGLFSWPTGLSARNDAELMERSAEFMREGGRLPRTAFEEGICRGIFVEGSLAWRKAVIKHGAAIEHGAKLIDTDDYVVGGKCKGNADGAEGNKTDWGSRVAATKGRKSWSNQWHHCQRWRWGKEWVWLTICT